MREIKFRGKRLDNGEWMYGDLYHINELTCICDWSIKPHTVENFAVDLATVGQFTGLFDKNGNEIYEGDVQKDKLGRYYIVEHHHGGYWLNSHGSGYDERLHADRQIEIIGNIHDNPELIKTE